jgi:hypothetical protein
VTISFEQIEETERRADLYRRMSDDLRAQAAKARIEVKAQGSAAPEAAHSHGDITVASRWFGDD